MSELKFKKVVMFLLLSLAFAAFILNPIVLAVSPLAITVKTNKTSYHLRENVAVSGNVTYNGALVDKGLAGIQVLNSLATFVIRTQLVGPIGSQTYPVQIVQVTLSDMYGNPRQTVVRPTVSPSPATYVTIKVKNNGAFPRTILITGNVFDNDSIPIGMIVGGGTLGGNGWMNVTQSMYIEQWAKNGTATIYANIYSDWPKEYGYPLCPEKAATFAILESSYDESLPGQAPQQTIQNGTYHVNFKLSPEPKPGSYEVYATASHPSGWHTDSPTLVTFQVVDIAAPPRASFVIAPPRATANYTITFYASSSTPEGYNETITNYKWNFGDMQQTTGKTVTHSYTSFGNYTVTLNVTDNEGLWNTTTRIAVIKIIHNVAILNMSSLDVVFNDWKAPVYVRVKNRGTVPDSFNVTLYVNGTLYATRVRINNLAAYAINTTTITWDTTGLTVLRNDSLTAKADTLPGEINTADNTCTYGPVQVRHLGDIYFDRKINVLDLVKVTGIYGSKTGDALWNIMADLYPDGKIDISDVVKITGQYGYKY